MNPNIGSNELLILLGISIATLMAKVESICNYAYQTAKELQGKATIIVDIACQEILMISLY